MLQVGETGHAHEKCQTEADRAAVPAGRKEKPPSEEGRVDRLWRPRQGVDRARLLPVVRQRGSVVLAVLNVQPLLLPSAFFTSVF